MAETITIRGLDISYQESNQIMIASGNAQFVHPDFTISANRIQFDQRTHIITGESNVEIRKDSQLLFSDSFTYNTQTNETAIDNVSIELSTPNKASIHISAITFLDMGDKKTGTDAYITTCDNPSPHYHVSAKKYTIVPGKRIIGQDVHLETPIFFLPFGFWTPAYIFDIGKRSIIYLMPVIGSNKMEGGFIKNQFDYVITDEWTGSGYMDYMSDLGVGLGTKVSYTNDTNYQSDLYYYGVLDSEYSSKQWNQTIQLSPSQTFSTDIQSTAMYFVNGGTSRTDAHRATLQTSAAGYMDSLNYSFQQNSSSTIKPRTYALNYKRSYDDNGYTNLSFSQNKSSTTRERYSISNRYFLGYDIESYSNIQYNQHDVSSLDPRKESTLYTHQSFKKRLDFGTIKTSIEYYFDTDDDRVTSDITNHVVQKTPEIDVSFVSWALTDNWDMNHAVQYGYYTEHYYITSLNKQRIYDQSRIILDQRLTGSYAFNFLNSQFTSSTSYKQYYYGSNDQTFSLSSQLSYQTDTGSFLQTTTSHTRSWVPDDGNTPFYFDEKYQREKNELKETITLYVISPNKYSLKFSSGYNWIVDYQLDNYWELNVNPTPQFSSKFKTTYMHQRNEYSSLSGFIKIVPHKQFNTTIQAIYDLNDGELETINHKLSGETSSHWPNRWIFNAYFTYSNTTNKTYQLQTLEIVKDLHCRSLTFMYNRILEEYRFQFTVNAFPKSNIGFSSNKNESFRIEGVFDDASIQR